MLYRYLEFLRLASWSFPLQFAKEGAGFVAEFKDRLRDVAYDHKQTGPHVLRAVQKIDQLGAVGFELGNAILRLPICNIVIVRAHSHLATPSVGVAVLAVMRWPRWIQARGARLVLSRRPPSPVSQSKKSGPHYRGISRNRVGARRLCDRLCRRLA